MPRKDMLAVAGVCVRVGAGVFCFFVVEEGGMVVGTMYVVGGMLGLT